MKEIPLTQGLVALIDDAEFEKLNQFKWYAGRGGKTFYAKRNVLKQNGKKTTIRMHRIILGIPNDKQVDHIDGNGLNNQRVNLRSCTNAENMRNRHGLTASNTSGYRGVSWNKSRGKFQARIRVNGLAVYLGRFTTAVEASGVFDAAAQKHYGDFYTKESEK